MKPGEKRGRGEVVWIESDGVREEREKERERAQAGLGDRKLKSTNRSKFSRLRQWSFG